MEETIFEHSTSHNNKFYRSESFIWQLSDPTNFWRTFPAHLSSAAGRTENWNSGTTQRDEPWLILLEEYRLTDGLTN